MDATWNTHKETIRELYLVQDLSRQEVMRQMEGRHSFKADAGQFERQFKKWGFRKNLPPDTWHFVARRLGKRKREGKETDFKIDGIRVPEKKLKKAISRYGEGPTWEIVQHKLRGADCGSPTPEGLSFSPQAICSFPDQEHTLDRTLPWLKFSSVATPWLTSQPHSSEALTATGVQFPREVSQRLSRLFLPTMPDGVPQPRYDLAHSSHPNNLMLMVFLSSNHIQKMSSLALSLAQQNMSVISSIMRHLQGQELSELWELMDVEQNPTIDALSEVCFKEALESQNVELVKRLLKTLKFNVNDCLPCPARGGGRAPLHTAITSKNSEMVRLLLDHGADPHQCDFDDHDMLYIAADVGDEQMFRLLLKFHKGDSTAAFKKLLQEYPYRYDEEFWIEMLDSTPTMMFGKELLVEAAYFEWFSVVQYLLHHGTAINAHDYNGFTPLLAAVAGGNLEITEMLLSSGANAESSLDYHHRRSPTALQLAIWFNNSEITSLLVNNGAVFNAEGYEWGWEHHRCTDFVSEVQPGETALSIAVEYAGAPFVQLLLRKGAQADDMALARAVEQQRPEITQLLLEYGAPCSNHVLFAAAGAWDLDMIQRCLDAGVDVNHIQDGLSTLGSVAFSDGALAAMPEVIFDLLLRFGADINLPGVSRTALEVALETLDTSPVEFLLSRGAHCDTASTLRSAVRRGDSLLLKKILAAAFTRPGFHLSYTTSCIGHPALFEAISKKYFEMADILLQADVNIVTPCAARALQILCGRRYLNIDLIRRLIETGIQIDLPERTEHLSCWQGLEKNNRKHPLQILAREGQDEAMRLLLRYGANPNLIGQSRYQSYSCYRKRSIFCDAVESGKLSTVQLLLEAGADINISARGDFGRTALQMAAECGHMDIFEELIRVGADVNADPAESGGVTALQAAAIGGYLGIATRLIDAGADVNACAARDSGRTALEGACEHGRIDMVQFLLNSGADVQSSDFGAVQYERSVNFAKRNGFNAVARLLQRHRASLG